MSNALFGTVDRTNRLLAHIPAWFVLLLGRLAVSSVFWWSVQTKITGWEFLGQNWKFWNISASTFLLFENEYTVPLLPPDIAAYLATFAEFFFSIAIVLGFLTRLSACGLLLMTLVIQFFVYPDGWNAHILWAALLVYLIRYGGGAVSVDNLLLRRPG